jgi:alpha,alpha-trehalase
MLFFLFTSDELVEQLRSMGYSFDPAWIPANVDYYVHRTSHGSTLSRVVHSWVLARSDRPRSFRLFQEALWSDVGDIQMGTTAEGIHLGAMAGTVDLVKRGYTGATARDGILWLEPRLPAEIGELRTRFRISGAWLDVRVTHDVIEVEYSEGSVRAARFGINGHVREVPRGSRVCVRREPKR